MATEIALNRNLVTHHKHNIKSTGGVEYWLDVELNYRIIEDPAKKGEWKVSTTKYNYTLRDEKDELLAYHWHPGRETNLPHMHIYHAMGIAGTVAKKQIYTGRIALELVIQFLIEAVIDLPET